MATQQQIIFVLGVCSRTGTNLTRGLLLRNSACMATSIHEDYFLARSPYLRAFAESVNPGNKPWLAPDDTMAMFGKALRQYLWDRRIKKPGASVLVAKTPSTEGLQNFDVMFPGQPVIFVYRDPRDVAVSAERSFNRPHMVTADNWCNGVTWMKGFRRAHPTTTYAVRYEDLVLNRRPTLQALFDWLGLSEPTYTVDWDGVDDHPIRGSSELVENGGQLHWHETPMREDFNPIGRWKKVWDEPTIRKFEDRVAYPMSQLGYAKHAAMVEVNTTQLSES
jgi:hypothetical protein